MTERSLPNDPLWLKRAFADLGLDEISGSRHNARVLKMFKLSGHPEIQNDETAWCSAAANAWMVEAGLKGTGALNARSWLNWGKKLPTTKIPRGAVLIFKRGTSAWQGHVTLCLKDEGSTVTCIGGNQSDSVNIARYRKTALIGARWPADKATKTNAAAVAAVAEIPDEEAPAEISAAARMEPEETAPAPAPPAGTVRGDPELWHVQRRLERMGYNPGGLDGDWGTNTAGAVAGFIGGRKLDIIAPTSMEMFREVQEELKVAIGAAESDSHKRLIVPERKFADAKTVEAAAPEIVPVKQSRLAAIWAAISGFFLMIFNAVAEYFRDAMEWIGNVKDMFTGIPVEIWFALGIGICVFFAWKANKGASGITSAFKTGERL